MRTWALPVHPGTRAMTRWTAVLMAAGLALSGLAPSSAAALRAPDRAVVAGSLRLGHVTLRRCATLPLTYCGGLAVPLDYSSAASPDIHIGFRLLPASGARRAAGTVLAVEGGPGFATTGSEALFLAMMGPLARTGNLLLVDLRGTGTSTPLNCPGLENYGLAQHLFGPAFNRLVGACGRQLNHTWRYRNGGWVQASDLFNTAYSARDVSAVLRALRLGRVDLYGDSYGSWFAQVLASRYPGELRSVTLDSTYQVLALDPWYTTTVVTARTAFAQACSRSAACEAAAGGRGAWARITALAARLGRSPVTGETVAAGTRVRLTVTAETLVNLVNNAGFDPVVYRDLDAAGRALLRDHDPAPLLRLAALSIGFDDTNFPLPEFSDGLYFAVACSDYVQLFSRSAPPAARAVQFAAAARREPRHVFAPFSVTQWTEMDQYTEAFSACLGWPTPTRLVPPITRRPPLVPRRLPVLVLSGTLDSLTPWLHGATLVARQMGPSARVVRIANLTHVTLQNTDDSCPASIYQRFVRDPAGLKRENTSCAQRVAPIHTVGGYPLLLADAVPARALRGNTAGRRALQAASVAVASVGDEVSRWPLLGSTTDLGLRGGQVSFSGGFVLKISFHNVRWVSDATIDGAAQWNQLTGTVTALLTVHIAGTPPVHLAARWLQFGQQDQPAVVAGSQGSHVLAATCPAP
jgi:pimeloyl-ACP methyl ester carboxylesterase